MLQQVGYTAHWEAWNEYGRDNMQTWDDIHSILFYSMKHLPVHLPYEAKVEGPVHYRWMSPFERLEIKYAM